MPKIKKQADAKTIPSIPGEQPAIKKESLDLTDNYPFPSKHADKRKSYLDPVNSRTNEQRSQSIHQPSTQAQKQAKGGNAGNPAQTTSLQYHQNEYISLFTSENMQFLFKRLDKGKQQRPLRLRKLAGAQ